MLNLDNKLLTV